MRRWIMLAATVAPMLSVACADESAPNEPEQKGLVRRVVERIRHPFQKPEEKDAEPVEARPRKDENAPRFPVLREIVRVSWAYFTSPLTVAESVRQFTIAILSGLFLWLIGSFGLKIAELRYRYRQKNNDGKD